MTNERDFIDKSKYRLITIAICFFLWWLYFIPLIIGIVLLKRFINDLKQYKQDKIDEIEQKQSTLDRDISRLKQLQYKVTEPRFLELQTNIENSERKLEKANEKIKQSAYLFKSIQEYLSSFADCDLTRKEQERIERLLEEIGVEDYLSPTAEIKLHCTDMKDLKKQYREINKNIDSLLLSYEKRYTTTINLTIYRLMVLGLRAELQNVLYNMKFGKLEDAENAITEITEKYCKIALESNKTIAPTVVKFVKQMESLFIDSVRVEYEYYVRRERAKEEQKALRAQMREEAEERKRLEEEKKKIEKEESKYTNEMQKLQEQMATATDEKSKQLSDRIAELETLLSQVNEKKETISKLQNGKAGYVYVISNLGSFGDRVFKIGMTRRREPQERVDELGDASVPFAFDVHSFIFSEDAPTLETAIHHRLNDRRVNKVNLRKEFFDISLDELEALVYELEPSAEFNKTMAAEQYRQSLSMTTIFDSFDEDDDNAEEEGDIA